MADEASIPSPAPAGDFSTTHWSVVLSAGRLDDPRSRAALAQLCQTYWYPLYAFVRRQGHRPEDAKDLTQGFFLHLIDHHALATADPARGKFRSFLLASLRHFLSNEQAREGAQKRGGGCAFVSFDAASAETRYGFEADDSTSPERIFDRNWALALMERVLSQLEAEQTSAGHAVLFSNLRDCLMGEPDAPRYADLSARLGTSSDALKMAVSRLRRRYRELMREELAHTVTAPAEVEQEIRHLFAALGS
jgi:DNA-directed RNA polymerase specialized sigma24 family protein